MYVRKRVRKWECLIRYKGSRFQKSFHTRANAVSWGNKTLAALEKGTYIDNDKVYGMQLKDLLLLYYEHVKGQTKRPYNLKYNIDMLSRKPIGKCYLPQVNGVKLSAFKNEMLKLGKSHTTVKKYLQLIGRAFTLGRKELGVPITNNPVSMVTLPKEPAHRDRILNERELSSLYDALDNHKPFFMRTFVELLIETLCRRGELLDLIYNDCDFTKRIALIRDSKNGESRRIGLTNRAIELIKSLPRNINGRLFNIGTISSFEKSFNRAVARARIEDFRMHDTRHMGATFLAQKGWTTQELMAQGGWKSAEMVSRYANISAEHLAKRINTK